MASISVPELDTSGCKFSCQCGEGFSDKSCEWPKRPHLDHSVHPTPVGDLFRAASRRHVPDAGICISAGPDDPLFH